MDSTIKRLVVLISGTGASLQGILDATRWQTLRAEVVRVISHEPWSYGLLRAEREGIPTTLHDLADYRAGVGGKEERDYLPELIQKIKEAAPDLVLLAGWQLPLTDPFFAAFRNQVLALQTGRQELAPLWDPYGQNPISRALDAFAAGGVRETEVSVQMLNNALGHSRVVAKETVPIYESDTLIDLEERVNRVQQELLVNTLALLLREAEEPEYDY